jgi:hypothetical protein
VLGGYGPDFFEAALTALGERPLLPREAKVMVLVGGHVRDFHTQRRVDAERWRSDFEAALKGFAD